MSAGRFVPEEPMPPYAFVPGNFPHPTSDPAGHSFGRLPELVPVPDANHWQSCRTYLRGIDLFNHGFYWEAHEAWETVWRACGRRGLMADFFKALIHLAAAGVKIKEGRPGGVASHGKRAAELLGKHFLDGQTRFFGLNLEDLEDRAARLAKLHREDVVKGELDIQLEPQ